MHCSPCPTALVTEVQFWVLPGKPSVVSSLHSDGENVGLSLGQLFLPGEILSAHRSPSGGFGLFPHLIPLGSCSLITASKAGSCGGGPRGEHHPTKAVRKLPPCQEPKRALCPLSTLKYRGCCGLCVCVQMLCMKMTSAASQPLRCVPVDRSDPDTKQRKKRLIEAEWNFSGFFFNLSLSENTICLPQVRQRFQSPGSFALPNYCH